MFDFAPILGMLAVAFVGGFGAGAVAVFMRRIRECV